MQQGPFIHQLGQHYEDLLDIISPKERNSQVDVVCRLSNDQYAMVEIQVAPQNFWDERTLSYAAALYSNQLTKGDDWRNLKKVFAINILGAGPQNVAFWKDGKSPIRHYRFTDYSDHILDVRKEGVEEE